MIGHKFHAQPTELNGVRYASKKEARRAGELDLLKRGGEVVFYHRQPIFDLPGGVTYRPDFQIFWASGHVSYEDVKGVRTKDFIRNKKMVEALYPVKIEEV